jgi:transposase
MSGSETLQLLRTAYGDTVLSSAQVFRWHKAFKDGRESVEDEQRTVRPSTARTQNNVACVKVVLERDRLLQVRLIAEEVGLPKTDVHRLITEDLHMRKICAKLLPKNAPSHTSFAVREFLAQNKITTPPHPPYSPDLAPCDFFLFPKLKTHLKGHNFGTVENVQAAATRALTNISSEDFLHCYEEWQQRWNRCIRLQGAYFEGVKL